MTELEKYCREKAAPEGSNLYYGTLFEPNEIKSVLFSIFALHYEISDCLTVSPDPGVTHIKLHWWVEELQRLLDKQSRHPVTRSLLLLVDPNKISTPLKKYIEMIEFLTSGNEIYIVDDWLRFYSEAYGQIFHCAEIMITPSYAENKYLIFNGGTILTLEMLQSTPFLINKAYRLVPGELLDKHHLDISSINNTDNIMARVKIFEILLDNIKEELDKFHQYFCNSKTRLHLYHYCMNRIAMALCTEIQSDGNKIFEHKVVLTPLRKLLITYKARLKDSLVNRA